MYEKQSSNIYNDYIVEIANKVLAETYEENNMLRMFKGKLPFIDGVAAHQVSSLTDVLDYEDEYLLDVIPKGIDANFLMDDDLQKMSIRNNNLRNRHSADYAFIIAIFASRSAYISIFNAVISQCGF